MRTLFIGEDSGQHVNNFLWAYNVDTKALSRMHVDARRRRVDRPACGRRDQRLDLHHEQLPACRRLGQHPRRTSRPRSIRWCKANYKDNFGAAVGYLTADLMQTRLSKA